MKNVIFRLIFAAMPFQKRSVPGTCVKLFVLLYAAGRFLFFPAVSVAQDARKNTLIGYPAGFYLPETRWGIGAAASYNFFVSKKDSISPPGQVQIGFAYTQNRQLLFSLPFQVFWKQRLHSVSGELSYNDYSFYYYGVGNRINDNVKELYGVKSSLFRINYLYQFKPRFFGGLRWWYENYDIHKTIPGGELSQQIIPGSAGSVTSGPGLVFLFDSRDNIYYSTKGAYLELVYHNQDAIWGSHFTYDRYRFDARRFFSLGKKQCLALEAFGDFISGDAPFNQMPNIGSAKRMRGYYEGRYRNQNMLMLQTEYRIMPFRRWGLAVFAGNAFLWKDLDDLQIKYSRLNAGAGIRFAFDRAKKINLRLDYAVGKNSSGVYFTIGEAF